MGDEIRLRATRDIPGVRARLADGGYTTRRLKAGDVFYVTRPLAALLVTRMQKAELAREPGKIAPPPLALKARLPQLDHDHNGKEGGATKQSGEGVAAKRAEYLRVVGKRPFNGWNEAELDRRIAEAGK